ncbi:glutamine synthetase, partial [Clostridium tyrobutyricum]|nr:glutamine synthetase [Clostridium tyrobutyricum]
MSKDLIYSISKENHSESDLKQIVTSHPEIKFVSAVGVDLSGNNTDEKIPIKVFLDDIYAFLKGAV